MTGDARASVCVCVCVCVRVRVCVYACVTINFSVLSVLEYVSVCIKRM